MASDRLPPQRSPERDQQAILDALGAPAAEQSLGWDGAIGAVSLLTRLIVLHEHDGAEGRAALRSSLDLHTYHLLLVFAQHMATLAVQERSLERLGVGLKAIALAGSSPISDWRDTGIRTLPLRDAAARLGPASLRMFDQAALLATPETARLLVRSKPSFSLWGRIGTVIGRQLAQTFWRPSGSGTTFQYGGEYGISRGDAERLAEAYRRRMDELGYRYPEAASAKASPEQP